MRIYKISPNADFRSERTSDSKNGTRTPKIILQHGQKTAEVGVGNIGNPFADVNGNQHPATTTITAQNSHNGFEGLVAIHGRREQFFLNNLAGGVKTKQTVSLNQIGQKAQIGGISATAVDRKQITSHDKGAVSTVGNHGRGNGDNLFCKLLKLLGGNQVVNALLHRMKPLASPHGATAGIQQKLPQAVLADRNRNEKISLGGLAGKHNVEQFPKACNNLCVRGIVPPIAHMKHKSVDSAAFHRTVASEFFQTGIRKDADCISRKGSKKLITEADLDSKHSNPPK